MRTSFFKVFVAFFFANAFCSDGPWQYDAPSLGGTTDYFSVMAFGGGRYDLTCYGPNGFQRRFEGTMAARERALVRKRCTK